MKNALLFFWKSVGNILVIFGLYVLPKNIQDIQDYNVFWRTYFWDWAIGIVNQQYLTVLYMILLTIYIVWSDIRSYRMRKYGIVSKMAKFVSDYEEEKPNFIGSSKDIHLRDSETLRRKYRSLYFKDIAPIIHKYKIKIPRYMVQQDRWDEILEEVQKSCHF